MSLLLPEQYTKQPLVRTTYSTKFGRPVLLVNYGVSGVNLVTGRAAQPELGELYSGSQNGNIRPYKDSICKTNTTDFSGDIYSLPNISDFTLIAVIDHTDSGTGTVILDRDSSVSRQFQFRFYNSTVELITFDTSGNPYFVSIPHNNIFKGVFVARRIGNVISVFSAQGSASTTCANTPKPLTEIMFPGSFGWGYRAKTTDRVFGVYAYPYGLTDSDIKSSIQNPWQVFNQDPVNYSIKSFGAPAGNTYNVDITLQYSNSVADTNILAALGTIALNTSLSEASSSKVSVSNAIVLSQSNSVITANTANVKNSMTLSQVHTTSTSNVANVLNVLMLNAAHSVSTSSALQATGNIQVGLSVGSTHGISSNAILNAKNLISIGTNVEIVPKGNTSTNVGCTFNTTSSVYSAGGFSIQENLALGVRSTLIPTMQLQVSGDISLTSALGQAINSNAIINGQVMLTATIAEGIIATIVANEFVGVDFKILSTYIGTNPSVLTRIGSQEILFTIATSKLHFINSGKDTLFTSS